ncbi:MAG: thiamine phosphate synthase [Deltaproteobacteria bacterium]|nr:thiamine phosphate synthase [Deltaproteobacteria bacterium]
MKPAMSRGMGAAPLYPIVNVSQPGATAAARATALALALAEAGLPWLQLRAKPLGTGEYASLARSLVAKLDAYDCRLIVNDRADVALAAGAWGLHVGDEDLPVVAARALLGSACLIGFSTHAVDEVSAACRPSAEARADDPADRPQRHPLDYIGFGPVFESPTKAGVRAARGLRLLAQACRASSVPVVAIGGITVETAPLCWRAGAACVAVISELERAFEADRLDDLLRRYRDAALAHGLPSF